MRSKIFIIFLFLFSNSFLFAENLKIESKNITLDKNKEISIFQNQVNVTTEAGNKIKSEYAEYNKKLSFIKFEKNIIAVDKKNNRIETEYAEYSDISKVFISKGKTNIFTTEQYKIVGSNITLDNKKGIIKSQDEAIITDKENNKIFLDNFEYQTKDNIFKSIGLIKIEDKMKNVYEFSQIYIDTKKREILGTDIKAFMNDKNFKIHKKNKPRIFANTLNINNNKSSFNKSVFTLCDYRKEDKCPPWSIRASEMLHDNKKKTIYYDNALIKVYNIPIFYLPKLSHPDPSVDRRSGFLPPSFSDTKNLGTGVSIPYFWAINHDKNFTLTNKIFASENPLFIGEYHQAFENSFLLTDIGYTEGYKKSDANKKKGDKSHFFSKFVKNFNFSNNSDSTLSVLVQNVSDDKYLKLHKIKSKLVDFNSGTLENSIDFTHENEDIFFGFNTSVYETITSEYNDKYEYIYPEITLAKNILSNEKFGRLDLQTNYKINKYETNKFTNFLVNDLDWNFKEVNHSSGFNSKIFGNIKNVNYETKNVDIYKKDTTSEIYGALGYLSEIDFRKKTGQSDHLLKPKVLFRYAPGGMRKETEGTRLSPSSAFSLDRIDNINNFETGLSSTFGFDYNIKKNEKEFDFSVAQIINEKENKDMASKTSLDEKISDLVGKSSYKINNNMTLNYNFSVDQNYNELNYSEIGTKFDFEPLKINFNYLLEDKHIGDQEYFTTKLNLERSNNGVFSFETKRNLITNSSEFYNLSYEYLNDCLRAGIVYRREFYTDSELEAENSLMFKITLTPFGNINTPSFY